MDTESDNLARHTAKKKGRVKRGLQELF